MTMGVSECQADLFRGTGFVGDRVGPGSVFALLFGEGDRLFPDAMFADLFSGRGRRSARWPRCWCCKQLIWSVVLLVVVAVLHFTGLFAAILVWAGDIFLEQIEKIGNTQTE